MIPDSFFFASTWIFPTAKFGFAPGWHFPHVFGTFFGFTMESGSSGGRMSCTPWQEEQFATVREPNWFATPWNDSSVSYTHLRAHETRHDLVCRLLLEKKKKITR